MKTQAEKLSAKRARDARVVTTMIEMHCKGVHRTGKVPCPECAELIAYCSERVEQCPRAEEKTFCSSCPHPCYTPAMRERIREVMRWSGPRMLFVHPVLAVRHALDK
ncbi:MAG: nitrous oxide-stimulated promoter family protein [Coriobacteriales bacterium]|jgi:hypothetical protein